MKNAGEVIKIGLILFVITAVAAALLAVVNNVTAPLIEQNKAAKQMTAMKNVISSAETFDKADFVDEAGIVTEAYTAKDSSGSTVGSCIMVSPLGYGGNINMAVGIDNEGKVTGVDIISMSETAGLGANAKKDEFKGQYTGKSSGITVTKKAPDKNEISAISGATITSKAVTSGVNAAINAASEIAEKGGIKNG